MTRKPVLSFCLASFLAPSVFGFSSDGSLLLRSFDHTSVLTNSVIVVSAGFTNTEAASLRGFYYTDQVPSGLAVATLGVVLNGQSVTNYTVEVGQDSDVYAGCTPYRWVLEQPTNFAQANPIPPGAGLQIVYSISCVIPGVFNLQQFGWVGFDPLATNAAFGYSESADQVAVSFLASPHNAFRITPAGSPTAVSPYALTITAVDQYQNTVTSVTGDHSFTFAGLALADDGTSPTITDKNGNAVNLGTATTIRFTNGVNSAGGRLVAYKAQTATLTGSDATSGKGTGDTGGTGASLTIANVIPVAGADTETRAPNLSLKILKSKLVGISTDANHDVLSVSGMGATSTGGAALSANATYVFYTPNTAGEGDTFTYTVSDGNGGTATGTVTVHVAIQPGGPSGEIGVSGGVASVKVFGIPGFQYDVQRSTNLNIWTTLTTAPPLNTAPPFTASAADGSIRFTDSFSDLGSPPASAYYRIMAH